MWEIPLIWPIYSRLAALIALTLVQPAAASSVEQAPAWGQWRFSFAVAAFNSPRPLIAKERLAILSRASSHCFDIDNRIQFLVGGDFCRCDQSVVRGYAKRYMNSRAEHRSILQARSNMWWARTFGMEIMALFGFPLLWKVKVIMLWSWALIWISWIDNWVCIGI